MAHSFFVLPCKSLAPFIHRAAWINQDFSASSDPLLHAPLWRLVHVDVRVRFVVGVPNGVSWDDGRVNAFTFGSSCPNRSAVKGGGDRIRSKEDVTP